MPTSTQQSMNTIDAFLNAVGSIKAAESPLSEPGSIGGETSHPVKSVDDRLEKAKEGERFKENTKDVNEDQGKPSVQNAPEAKAASAGVAPVRGTVARLAKKADGGAVQTAGSAADDAEESVLNVQPTGEDPANETGSAKGGKEDPGSSHPARTDNDSLDGHKFAYDASTPLEKMAGIFKDLGEAICANISWISREPATKQAAQAQSGGRAPAPVKQAAIDAELAAQAGWEVAGLVNGTLDKAAADRMVAEAIEEVIKAASDDADHLAAYYAETMPALMGKIAQGEMPLPGGGEQGGGAPQQPPEGGDMPGEDPSGGGGGEEAGMMDALGGAPGGAQGGMPGGGAGGGDPTQEILQLMEQMGITPEEMEAAIQAEMGGGGAGGDPTGGGGTPPPPPGGGMPPPGGGAGGGMEVQASHRPRNDAAVKVANIQQYLTELISRSRARKA